jgi:hypothetical protein
MVTSPVKAVNPMDAKMTPAQVARRKFKSGLLRKPLDCRLSAMEALGELFTLLDRFRGLVAEQGVSVDTVHAALAYYLPSTPAVLADFCPIPDPPIGAFCDWVMSLDNPQFLGVLFIQVDPGTSKPAYGAVGFGVPFMGGPDAAGRLLAAQQKHFFAIQKVLDLIRH